MAKRYVAALILCLLLNLPQAAWANEQTNWVTRGKTADRVQMTEESLGPVDVKEAWAEPAKVGATGSQPLLIDDRIYHLAGDGLWVISADGNETQLTFFQNMVQLPDNNWTLRPSTSGLTYREVGGDKLLYYGTGDNRLCVYGLNVTLERCHRLTDPLYTEEPIVAVPLVLTTTLKGRIVDIVIMGDKRGRVWAVQGLATAESPEAIIARFKDVGGWVLASPVQVGPPGALAFLWASTSARIGAFQVTPADGTQDLELQNFWTDPVIEHIDTYAGVADGFAKDGDFAYAADTAGNFYQIETLNGRARTNKYAQTAGPMFANAAPAIDQHHIYFTIRNVGTATPSTSHHGRLVALHRRTFQLAWTADLDAPANTNPLVWASGPNVVLVGDTKGNIHSFNPINGEPRPFAADGCTPVQKLSVGTIAGQAGEAFQTTTGLSEPILASGTLGQALLLAGISGKDAQGHYTGHLTAFRSGSAYNIAWTPTALPAGATALGQTYPIHGTLALDPWSLHPPGPRTVGVRAYWQSADGASRPISDPMQVTLQPGVPRDLTFPFTPIEADGTSGRVVVVANPDQLILSSTPTADQFRAILSATGTTVAAGALASPCGGTAEAELLPEGPDAAMADNLLQASLTIAQQVDLTLTELQFPADLFCSADGTSARIAWKVQNPSARTLRDVAYRVTMDGVVVETGTRTLRPGESQWTSRLTGWECDVPYTVIVEINQPRSVPEPAYANNVRSGELYVESESSSGGGDRPVLTSP
jgi:hypothetical protein